ncbi:hypothetical protein IWZ03DRAFT_443582 [Phyllosticta citriasiana]|uniref:Uncharacterized protein n=1 Tax=Phyllosticta citriasiana TaxID=595635 RepID=A0ABR1KHG8_9PEZI
MAQYDDDPPNTLLTLFQHAFWIAIFSYLFCDQFWRPILGTAPSPPPSPRPTPEATLQQQQARVQAPVPAPNAPGNPPNANAERQICPCPNCRLFENAGPTDRERQQQNPQNPPPQQPRPQAQPRWQNPHGPVRRPPWRAPDFRNLPVPMNRRVNRNAEGITPPPGAARRHPRPRPQVFQLPAGTVLNGGNNTNGNGAAEAPLPAPVVDQRIRERDLILPLLFPLPMTVGSPVEPLRAANPNGLFTTAQPLFPPIQQGTGNGNGATQPQLPAAELPGQNLQPRNENEQIPAPQEMDVDVNFVMLPSPMAQTLVDDPNGFWETARAIDPENAGFDADSVVFDAQRHPRNRVHDYTYIDDPIVDQDGDVIMSDVDTCNELSLQLQEQLIQHCMYGGFSDEEVNRFAQDERLRGSTDATAAGLRRRFVRWRGIENCKSYPCFNKQFSLTKSQNGLSPSLAIYQFFGLVLGLTLLISVCLLLGIIFFVLPCALYAFLYVYVFDPSAQLACRAYNMMFPWGIYHRLAPAWLRSLVLRVTGWYHGTTLGWIMRLQNRRLRREMTLVPEDIEQQTESILDSWARPQEDYAEIRMRAINAADERRRMREAGVWVYA